MYEIVEVLNRIARTLELLLEAVACGEGVILGGDYDEDAKTNLADEINRNNSFTDN